MLASPRTLFRFYYLGTLSFLLLVLCLASHLTVGTAVCVLPSFMQQHFKVPFSFGGTGLLIVVGVALDTVQQIEQHLISRNYEGFAGPRGPRIRGRLKVMA